MKTRATELLGIELPIPAFTHSRDVVAAVSRAGGRGVLGAANFTPKQLEQELNWIDAHAGDKTYGVDLLIPNTYQAVDQQNLDLNKLLPAAQQEFVTRICGDVGLPQLHAGEAETLMAEEFRHINITPEEGDALIEIALRHPKVTPIVNALGTPPKEKVAEQVWLELIASDAENPASTRVEGLAWPSSAASLLRHALVARTWGASEIQHNIIAQAGLGLPH